MTIDNNNVCFLKTMLEAERKQIEKILGYNFKNIQLLESALTHPSLMPDVMKNYQRLEFLGDALLGFLVAGWLFETCSDCNEGTLTSRRQMLVNSSALSKLAKIIGLDKFIKVKSTQYEQVSDGVISDIFEALLGAIYVDGGMKSARKFFEKTIVSHAELFRTSPSSTNYKGILLEKLQVKGFSPEYKLFELSGPKHKPTFKVGVYLGDELLGIGIGFSKKCAEQDAAREAIAALDLKDKP